jgi:threonylcarbamoyladenosine tRNA methylthiotransferase MtaB
VTSSSGRSYIDQPTVALTTVGCRLNQAETDAVQDAFDSAGYRIVGVDECPDVHYVNTCTVTGRADRSSRQWIHRARRDAPDSVIIVAGCFANRTAEELAEDGEVDVILGQREKMFPLRHIVDPHQRPDQPIVVMEEGGDSIPASVGVRVTGRSRAFLKVQDGCDHSCTYCAVAPARGPSISASVEEVKEALVRVVGAGYEEVVFTGVDLSDWSSDKNSLTTHKLDFINLIGLAVDAGLARVRISSLEPWSLSPERVVRLTSHDEWCEHLHLALQSGDPGVLKRMNRAMDLGQVREAIQELVRQRPHATIGADMIAGFPGETEEAFSATVDLLNEGWIHYLHVFPFSPRPGTPAARMKGQVDAEATRNRASELRKLSYKFKKEKMLGSVCHNTELLVERDEQTGYTKNYLRATLDLDSSRGAGKIIPVKITGYDTKQQTLEAEEIQ